jgi:hypothetical protein
MTRFSDATAAVKSHPRLAGVGRNAAEQQRLEVFAHDLARYLAGDPPEELGALARVVTRVARRELDDPQRLCRGRALLAVESAARVAALLWPWLRDFDEAPPPPPPPPASDPDGEAGEGGGDIDGDGSGDGEGAADAEADGDAEGGDPDDDAGDDDGDGGDSDGQPDGEPAPGAGESPELPHRDAIGEAAISGALDAERVSRQLERFLPGLGWSQAPGALDSILLERLDRLAVLVARAKELEAIAVALGRVEDAVRRQGSDPGGGEEVTGVHLGGEVHHALPAELALLGDADTEDLFYQRLVEKRLLSLELMGGGLDGASDRDSRGPVIACIDTSGSMEGEPELGAKALVLALCRRILPKGRAIHLLLFGARDERTEIRLRRGRGGLEGLIEFLGRSFHAGTDFDTPLLRAVELLDERGWDRADILVVTDGLCRAAPHVVRAVEAARAHHGVKVWSVVLGAASVAGVDPFSDEVWQLRAESAGEAVTLIHRLGGR